MTRFAWMIAAILTVMLASSTMAKDPKDRMWLALKSVQCGSMRLVVWREVDDPTDYYATL
jgi:hypothetical protein